MSRTRFGLRSLQTVLIPVSSSSSALQGCTVLPLKPWTNVNAFCPHGSTLYDGHKKGFICVLKNRREITTKKKCKNKNVYRVLVLVCCLGFWVTVLYTPILHSMFQGKESVFFSFIRCGPSFAYSAFVQAQGCPQLQPFPTPFGNSVCFPRPSAAVATPHCITFTVFLFPWCQEMRLFL